MTTVPSGHIDYSRNLRTLLDQRVTDGVIRRMIDNWLKAGAVEDGLLRRTTEGSPQGGVISPCLSNVFLHYVLDEWFETEVRPRLKGERRGGQSPGWTRCTRRNAARPGDRRTLARPGRRLGARENDPHPSRGCAGPAADNARSAPVRSACVYGHVSKQEMTETLLTAMRCVLRGEIYGPES